MTISANSYGSTSGVSGLVPRYANTAGAFDGTTRPTATQVESYIDQISSMVNFILAGNGFAIPISAGSVKPMLDLFVNQEVASICEGINGSGRFGPTDKTGGKSRYQLISSDIQALIETSASGFILMGAVQTTSVMDGILYRGTDEGGDPTSPIFQRKGFGNSFEDWDV